MTTSHIRCHLHNQSPVYIWVFSESRDLFKKTQLKTKIIVSQLATSYAKLAFYFNRHHVKAPLIDVIIANIRTNIFILCLHIFKAVFIFAVYNLQGSSHRLWIHVYPCTAAAKEKFCYDSSWFATKHPVLTARGCRALTPVDGDRTAAYFQNLKYFKIAGELSTKIPVKNVLYDVLLPNEALSSFRGETLS